MRSFIPGRVPKKTGQCCPSRGIWEFGCYTDGTTSPRPTMDELTIPMEVGCKFPPIKSACKGAFWRHRP
jgi:hypothetical protein